MHRHYVHDNCVQLDLPLLFGPNHGHNKDSPHIFVIFFAIRLLLDKDFLDLRQQCGGTVLFAHFFDCDFSQTLFNYLLILTCIVSKYIMYIYVSVYLYFV